MYFYCQIQECGNIIPTRQCHQEIFGVDEESRSALCYKMQESTDKDRHFLLAICFTGECTFTLNNESSVQNTRY
jgi:hypothetical protein